MLISLTMLFNYNKPTKRPCVGLLSGCDKSNSSKCPLTQLQQPFSEFFELKIVIYRLS